MKRKKRKSTPYWVYTIWGINFSVVICLLVAGLFYMNSQRASAANGQIETPHSDSSIKGPPTSYILPTLTPNPYYTLPVFETSTPFIFKSGEGTNVIGLSHGGRPIEVYKFGEGNREYLIVAGIHGGYERNTIALANELIRYIDSHPEVVPDNVTLYIIRNMNPDGEARAEGVDGRLTTEGSI